MGTGRLKKDRSVGLWLRARELLGRLTLWVSRSSVQTKGKITMQLLFRTAPESANAKWAPILTPITCFGDQLKTRYVYIDLRIYSVIATGSVHIRYLGAFDA